MKRFILSALVLSLYFPAVLFAQNGKWQLVKTTDSIPDRSECGMAVVNGKIYLIGNDGDKALPVECFDPQTSSWSSLAETPIIMHHFQPVAYKNKIYVLDAFSEGGFPNQVPMANVYSYDVLKNTWEKGGEIPQNRRRAGAAAAEYKGKLYLIAGIQHGHSSGTNSMFDCYDPETKTWSSLQDAPHIRDHCFATVIGNKLYVVGGRNTSFRDPENKIPFFAKTVLDVDVYDFNQRKWSTLPARLPLGSGGGNLVTINNVLYYMGGERATDTEQNAPRKNTYYLNPASQKEWMETDPLHFARNGVAAAVCNNKIYVAGGSGSPGGPPPGKNGAGFPAMVPNNMPPPPPGNRPPGDQGLHHSIKLEVFTIN